MGMPRVSFRAYGHENIVGKHKTTLELTSEGYLTPRGTCIIGINSEITLKNLDSSLKILAQSADTQIRLRLVLDSIEEEITGYGSPRLTYESNTSMVVRTSSYECGRTLMVQADKAASDLDREFIRSIQTREAIIQCELDFVTL